MEGARLGRHAVPFTSFVIGYYISIRHLDLDEVAALRHLASTVHENTTAKSVSDETEGWACSIDVGMAQPQ